MEYINDSILKKVYQPRPENTHKYDFGYLLIIGGSHLYTGAPALIAMAALRAGIDLSFVIAPQRAADIIASFSPNLIAYPLKGQDLGYQHLSSLISLTESAKRASRGKIAVAIGGGIGRDEKTQKLVNEYLLRIDIPAVIDADALYAVSRYYHPFPSKDIFQGKKFLLTPNTHEFFILSGIDISKMSLEEKSQVVKDFAQKENITVLLKEEPDIISDGENIFLNNTGCPEMSVGGTGDTLTGICGCFLSQQIEPIIAASAGAYLHGKAGEIAKEQLGAGLLATDIIESVPKVIKRFNIK
ncbi:MAG TPA: NAD(P)H-hydrate dehydratase [Candidatus Pacearchaeota archaeon]|nr:NAD(P)H-hydrate dehydratase [Candidatus Pacearchaeota archaeon]HPZ74424.1 NAD(P)H-hydrate dehydratase [Candidatus Pacearchaeota archaeon]HQD89065.1 NAD(P)H-hydrate dehydratase [Candidatus Pacearchaeota archaeon]